jgi:hypothetical protein
MYVIQGPELFLLYTPPTGDRLSFDVKFCAT